VIVSEVARPEQLAPVERLNPEKLMQDLKAPAKTRPTFSTWRPSSCTFQKMFRAAMSSWCSATAVSAGFAENCWNGWGEIKLVCWFTTARIIFGLDAGANIGRTGARGNRF
jgi:hypothetical protein